MRKFIGCLQRTGTLPQTAYVWNYDRKRRESGVSCRGRRPVRLGRDLSDFRNRDQGFWWGPGGILCTQAHPPGGIDHLCYALPGSLDSPLSAGCNQLIQQGAGILLNPENLLEEWGIETNVLCRNTEIKNEKNKKVLESTDDLVYSCVGLYPKNVDQIAQESRVEIRKLMSILVTLELQGYIREITKNYYIRIK